MEFNENALKLAPWSATKLKNATKCPFSAYQAYVAKAPEKWDVLPDDSPMIIGILVHKIMELVLGKFPKDQFPEMRDLQTLGQRMKQVAYKDDNITQKEIDAVDSLYHGTLNMCQRFLSHKWRTKSIAFTEIPVAIDKNLQATDFFAKDVFFRGKIDYLMVSPGGAVASIDAKTGAWPTLNGHSVQLRSYEALIPLTLKKKLLEEYNIKLTSVISGLAYVASEEMLWDKVKPLKLLEGSALKNFVDNINKVSDKVFEQEIKRGKHCNYCGYKHLCGSKVGQRKKAKEILM
jgi:CRISPR/Cas system-associated exonuclease Cas4 (RecB family)